MGVHGLLPFLKPFVKRRSLRDFSGKTIGVDAMCWMHKGAFSCAYELLNGIDTDKFIVYFIRHCSVLQFYKIKPVIVFDGQRMPAKAKEDRMRNEAREAARREAIELIERKNAGETIDEKLLSSKCEGAIKITSQMITRLQSALKELSIQFIVAPYEADAQLAFMCRAGWIHAAISEDSDLLAYGCPNTIFKMDKNGDGDNIVLPCLQPGAVPDEGPDEDAGPAEAAPEDEEQEEVEPEVAENEAGEAQAGEADKDAGRGGRGKTSGRGGRGRGRGAGRGRGKTSGGAGAGAGGRAGAVDVATIAKWTPEKFVEFCVLCGTDYKEHDVHIKGLGAKTAFKLLSKFRNAAKLIDWMRHDKRWAERFPCENELYNHRFRNVVAVFFHHIVFDPQRGRYISISLGFPGANRSVDDVDLESLVGTPITDSRCMQIAKGELDPRSLEPKEPLPLSPAERRSLDFLLERKRQEQRSFEAEHRRKEEAEAAYAAGLAKAAELASFATKQWTGQSQGIPDAAGAAATAPSGAGDALAAGETGAAADMEEFEDDKPPPEMILRNHDLSAIHAIFDEVENLRHASAPAASAPAARPAISLSGRSLRVATPLRPSANGADMATPPPTRRENPFARKRLSTGPASSASGGLGAGGGGSASSGASAADGAAEGSCAVLAKRPRSFGSAAPLSTSASATAAKPLASVAANGRPPATAQGAPEQRELVKPELHPRGGYAAFDAARAVLMQRGRLELTPLVPENPERGKLTTFFGLKAPTKPAPAAAAASQADTPAPVKRGLSAWRPRPWEAEEVEEAPDPTLVNPLSLKSNRGSSTFRYTQGWG